MKSTENVFKEAHKEREQYRNMLDEPSVVSRWTIGILSLMLSVFFGMFIWAIAVFWGV